MAIEINLYTGDWQQATRRAAPEVGTEVRVHESADAREWDDIQRKLRNADRMLDYRDTDGEWGVYRVVPMGEGEVGG